MDYKELFTGVILAGGKNSRFQGRIKSLELLNSSPILEHELSILSRLFYNILIITNSPNAFQAYSNYSIHEDIFKDKGPLGGIYAGTNYAPTPYIFVFGGDMPFLDPNLITRQMHQTNHKKADAIIPETCNGPEPLHGIYHTRIHHSLEKFLNEEKTFSVRTFLDHINTCFWQTKTKKAYININTPEELTHYEKPGCSSKPRIK